MSNASFVPGLFGKISTSAMAEVHTEHDNNKAAARGRSLFTELQVVFGLKLPPSGSHDRRLEVMSQCKASPSDTKDYAACIGGGKQDFPVTWPCGYRMIHVLMLHQTVAAACKIVFRCRDLSAGTDSKLLSIRPRGFRKHDAGPAGDCAASYPESALLFRCRIQFQTSSPAGSATAIFGLLEERRVL